MIVHDLIHLNRLLPPPSVCPSAPTREQLKQFEVSENVVLPEDYKKFTMQYGAGWIDDFVHVVSVVKERTAPSLKQEMNSLRRELAHFAHDEKLKLMKIWPANDCLIPWARTSNGDSLLTSQSGTEVVAIDSKGIRVESFSEGIIEFLCKYLSRERQVSIFPEDAALEGPVHVFSANFGTTFDDL